MVGVVTVPSAIALILFGPSITEVLYMGISIEDSRYIGYVLAAMGFGLIPFSINLILIRGFNAFEDTKTQVISIFIINVISVVLSYLFLAQLDSGIVTIGLGFAFSLSYIVGLFVTLRLIRRHVGSLRIRDFGKQHTLLIVASLAAMLPIYLVTQYLQWNSDSAELSIRALRLLLILSISGVGYFLASHLLKIGEIAGLREFATRTLRRRGK
jgi:putative peptidoglycan lipid II flippase